jgi:hypothetical protein
MYWRDEKCIQNFSSENLKGGDHVEDLGVNAEIMLQWILRK